MDTKKEDTIAELYALRAGLSVVSQCADAVKDYEKDIAELDKKVADGKAVIELGENEYKRKLNACAEFEWNIHNEARAKAYETIGYTSRGTKIFLGIISICIASH